MKKTKTYVLMISTQFPAYHQKKGEPTHFPEKILNAIFKIWPGDKIEYIYKFDLSIKDKKIHTIRTNYSFWEKRIKNIQEGKAVLSIRYWLLPGGCYKKGNRQIEIAQLDKNSGIGIQKVKWDTVAFRVENKEGDFLLKNVAKNDGLDMVDFAYWFQNCPEELMAIIHFTDFRY